MVNNSLLIIGGVTNNGEESFTNKIQVVRRGRPTTPWLRPDMPEGRARHCSTALEDGSIMVTGGITLNNKQGSKSTQVFDSKTLIWVTSSWMHILPKTGHFFVHFGAFLRPLLNWYHQNRHMFLNRFCGQSKNMPSVLILVLCKAPLGGRGPRLVLKV